MPVRKLNPTSAGRRFQTVSTFEEITRSGFERSLVNGMPERAGRNNLGRIFHRLSPPLAARLKPGAILITS